MKYSSLGSILAYKHKILEEKVTEQIIYFNLLLTDEEAMVQ